MEKREQVFLVDGRSISSGCDFAEELNGYGCRNGARACGGRCEESEKGVDHMEPEESGDFVEQEEGGDHVEQESGDHMEVVGDVALVEEECTLVVACNCPCSPS